MTSGADRLEFRVLGPFEVAAQGVALDLGGPRLRGVLARLLVDAGRTVSLTALVDDLWGWHAPPEAGHTVRTYVSRLRKALSRTADVLLTCPPGYVLQADPATVDSVRFEHLAAAGRRALEAGEPQPALDRLTEALGLWRGAALAEFDDMPVLSGVGARLESLRLTAIEDRNDAALALGLDSGVAAEIEELVRTHPVRERLWGQLMTVLYRSGRQAEALAAFRDARRVLLAEHGVEPSPALVDIQVRILRQDPGLAAVSAGPVTGGAGGTAGDTATVPATAAAAATATGTVAGTVTDTTAPVVRVPAQLPLDARDVVGREAELAALDSLLTRDGAPNPIPVLSGTAGVGKTTVAVHWAHRIAAGFPDGQLYINLRGYDEGGIATDPAEAVRGFLDALGVPPHAVPVGLPAQTALYRSLVAGRRVLVLLDNARDAEQVRPLLPGAPGCLVVVTSRDQLTPLVAAEGAVPLALGVLSPDRAENLLVRRLGRSRAHSDRPALEQIITRCAGLPLALAVASARIAVRPDFPLSVFAEELADLGSLDALHGGDAGTDLRSLFSWSCRTLNPEAAKLFRLLGLHPGPDITEAAAASLGALPVAGARRLLADLCRAGLLTEHAPGRYTFHDLLRAYAAELADNDEGCVTRNAAMRRVLDHYLHSAHAPEARIGPRVSALKLERPAPGVVVLEPGSHREALAWFAAERRVLASAVGHAHAAGFDRHAWRLAQVCTSFLYRQNLWPDLAGIQQSALAAATRAGDVAGRAHALRGLGLAEERIGDFDGARGRLLAALELFGQVADRSGQALGHRSLAWIAGVAGRDRMALEHAEQSLRLCRAVGDPAGEAVVLNDVGWYHARLGAYEEALACCGPALALLRRLGEEYGQAHAWDSLGYIHGLRGDQQSAIGCYRKAVRLFRRVGDLHSEAAGLTCLGDAQHAAGDTRAASETWRHALRALRALDESGHPDAAGVRSRLGVGGGSGSGGAGGGSSSAARETFSEP